MNFMDWILIGLLILSILILVAQIIVTDEYIKDRNFRKWISKFETFKEIFVILELDEDEKIKLKKN